MPVCYVEHCKTCWKPNDPYSMMHSFPRNRRLLREWLSRLPNKNLNIDQTLERILSSKQGVYRICTKHFTVDCYYATNSSRRLKKGALPTIFPLPPCKESEDQPELDDSDQSNGLKKRKPSSFIEHSYAVTSEPITINIEPDIASEGHIQTVVEEYFTVTIE